MAKKTVVFEVERLGDKLIIPEGVKYREIIETLQRKEQEEEQWVALNNDIDSAFVLDAALQLHHVLNEKFGITNNVNTKNWWGEEPPQLISVRVSRNEVVQVPWGRIVMPGIEGYIDTRVNFLKGRFCLRISGEVKKKHEKTVKEIVEAVRMRCRTHSIFRGKAFRLRLRDEHGDALPLPQPEFFDLDGVKEEDLIFNDAVANAIRANLFTPIEHTERVRKTVGTLKRGVLLAGKYGTGKTLVASILAKKCEENGWTYILCERATELADILRLASDYGPAVVFCEDLDAVMSGDRNLDMNEILNIVDGVESKSAELMIVMTTNHWETITKAMVRPGRIDAVIHMIEPDAQSVQRLIRQYGKGMVPQEEDLTEVGEIFQGNIPAVIREMVERAKLHAIREFPDGEDLVLTASSLKGAAEEMQLQLQLLGKVIAPALSAQEKAAHILVKGFREEGDTRNGHRSLVAAEEILSLTN